jgi:hypothetical protein
MVTASLFGLVSMMGNSGAAMQSWTKAVVPVEAAQGDATKLQRARDVSDLVAWAGGGTLDPERLQAMLAPDADAARNRGVALLLEAADGSHYLVTACHLLWNAAEDAGAASQPLLAPDRFWVSSSGPPDAATASQTGILSAMSQTELHVLTDTLDDPEKLGWFPAVSFPHLDLAVVRIDRHDARLCDALKAAGYVFVRADTLTDGPSEEGAEVFVVGLEPTPRTGNDRPHHDFIPTLARGKVTLLRDVLSFFWTDISVSTGSSGGPIVEGDRIVGIMTPQVAPAERQGMAESIPASLATVAKAAYVKTLIRAHESGPAA